MTGAEHAQVMAIQTIQRTGYSTCTWLVKPGGLRDFLLGKVLTQHLFHLALLMTSSWHSFSHALLNSANLQGSGG